MTTSPSTPEGLARFNALSPDDAAAALHAACGSHRWAGVVAAKRPFATVEDLLQAADEAWFKMAPKDWLEAFSHHPRIGETDLSQARFAKTAAQSSKEQSGMARASEKTRRAFVEGNAEYEEKFGYVFLICATGKSGEEMLRQLRRRVTNDSATELRNAVHEQSLITRIRLSKLVKP